MKDPATAPEMSKVGLRPLTLLLRHRHLQVKVCPQHSKTYPGPSPPESQEEVNSIVSLRGRRVPETNPVCSERP